MQYVCAWCAKPLNSNGDSSEDTPISHGICPECAGNMLKSAQTSLHDFLDGLGVPVLVAISEPRIRTANRFACELLNKSLEDIEGHRGGEVINCVHAACPGGCGSDVHCQSCTIRNTVLETFATGKPRIRIPCYPDIQFGQELQAVCIEITTEKVGDAVLLRIDDMRQEAPERLDSR